MICPCGYSFSVEPPEFKRTYESWVVVNDRDYPEFLAREVEVLKSAVKGEEQLARIAQAAALTGCVNECPRCARLYLSLPGRESSWFYLRESRWRYPSERGRFRRRRERPGKRGAGLTRRAGEG